MNNGDMPAKPLPNGADNRPYTFTHNHTAQPYHATGLTKREHFAGLAMQSCISLMDTNTAGNAEVFSEISEIAVSFADAILKELDK